MTHETFEGVRESFRGLGRFKDSKEALALIVAHCCSTVLLHLPFQPVLLRLEYARVSVRFVWSSTCTDTHK